MASSKSGGGDNKDKIKIGVAVGLLLIAGVVFYLVNFREGPKPPPATAEEIKAAEDHAKQVQKDVEAGKVAPGGAF